MTVLDLCLRLAGAFYMFAGFVLARAALTSRLLDQALAAITNGKTAPAERFKEAYSILLALIVFASGVTLAALVQPAVHLLLLGTCLQAAYVFWLAPRFIDGADGGGSLGRRQSTNALIIYALVTAAAAFAASHGRVQAWSDLSETVQMTVVTALVVFTVYLASTYVRTKLRSDR